MSFSSSSSSLSLEDSDDDDNVIYIDFYDTTSIETRFIVACKRNNVAAVQAEITREGELFKINVDGYTPLHIAAVNDSIDVVKWLLKQESSVVDREAKCEMGFTPLALACLMNSKPDSILELIEAGCNLNSLTLKDEYPLLLIIQNEYMHWDYRKPIIEALMKNEVDYDAATILKYYIVNYGYCGDCLEILHLLLYYNMDVNANGVEAFTFALKLGYLDVCDVLWDYIADFTQNSDELLNASIKHGYKYDELMEKGVDVSQANIFDRVDTIGAIFTSKHANAVELLNTLWMRFHSPHRIDSLIENTCTILYYYTKSKEVHLNKASVIRFFHLFFNFAFESKIDLFNKFNINKFHRLLEDIELTNDEHTQMIYLYLMCTSRISYDELFSLYEECSSRDVFEAFLKVNVHIDGDLLYVLSVGQMQRLVKHRNDDAYDYTKFDCILFPDLLPLDMKGERVASLVKLTRNVIRKRFQPDCATMTNDDLTYFRYYNKVNKLDVPKRIKDILLLNV